MCDKYLLGGIARQRFSWYLDGLQRQKGISTQIHQNVMRKTMLLYLRLISEKKWYRNAVMHKMAQFFVGWKDYEVYGTSFWYKVALESCCKRDAWLVSVCIRVHAGPKTSVGLQPSQSRLRLCLNAAMMHQICAQQPSWAKICMIDLMNSGA